MKKLVTHLFTRYHIDYVIVLILYLLLSNFRLILELSNWNLFGCNSHTTKGACNRGHGRGRNKRNRKYKNTENTWIQNCALATWPSGLGIGDKGWEGEPVFAERILCVKPPETVHTVGLATALKKTCDQKNLTRDTHNVDLREEHAFWGQCLRQACGNW